MNAPGLLLLAAWMAAVVWLGGMGDQARALAMAGIAAGLAAAAIIQPRALRPPPLAWWWPLAIAVALPPLLQALPLGAGHPWTAVDRGLLDAAPAAWAVDADAAARAAAWAAAWVGACFLGLVAWRGERALALAAWVVGLAAAHAAAAPILAVLVPEWPSPSFAGRVRGTFVYPNHAADLWAACLPLALALVRWDAPRRRWWIAAAAALATALVLSASRGGILVGALIALPFAWLALPRRRRMLWAGLAAAGVIAWLLTLGLDPVQERFATLGGSQGATFNGRLLIWQAAAGPAWDAGPIGAGPGAEPLAYLRGGEESFSGRVVDRLHSDPLEWLVCYGWVGCAVLLAAILLAAAWLRRRVRDLPADGAGRRARGLAVAAVAGVGVIALHSVAELSWHSPANALLAGILLVIAAGTLSAPSPSHPASARAWRLGLAGAAVAVAFAAWVELPRAAEAATAWDARRAAAARQRDGLPFDRLPALRRLLDEPVHTAEAALTGAEVALAAGDADPAAVERLLSVAAARSPGHPAGWAARGRLALLRQDADGLARALDRLAVWAPDWLPTRALQAAAIEDGLADRLPADQRRRALLAVLSTGRAVGPRLLSSAAAELGDAELARVLTASARGGLLPQAEAWLRTAAPLDDWLAIARRMTPRRYPPARELRMRALGAEGSAQVPTQAVERWAMARTLAGHRLPVPAALAAALAEDGPPAAGEAERWPAPGQPADAALLAVRAGGERSLAGLLHLPPAKAAWEDALAAAAILGGRTAQIGRGAWPPVLVLARAAATGAERDRLDGAYATVLARGWEELPDGAGRALWWDAAVAPPPVIRSPGWVGVAVDGVWVGWRRGDFAPPTPDPPRLVRVQLLF